MLTNRRAFLFLAASAIALAAIPGADAAPKEGEPAPYARAEDVEGR